MNPKEKPTYSSTSIDDLKIELEKRETLQKLKEQNATFLERFWSSLKKNTVVWMSTFVITILSIFSDSIIHKIQGSLNDSNLKSEEYASVADNFSEYNFSVELIIEFFDNKYEGSKYFTHIVDDYNESIHQLRRKEYTYLALIHKHSDSDVIYKYKNLMLELKSIDSLFHGLNPIAIPILRTSPDSLFKYTPEMEKEIDHKLVDLKNARDSLSVHTKNFLIDLE